MIVLTRTTTEYSKASKTIPRRSISSTLTMDAPKQGVLHLKSHKEKENVTPSALPRLSVKRDPKQPVSIAARKVSGSQPILGAAALRTQVDTLRAENAKLRKEHQRELAKLQDKSSQSEGKVQELVREKLARESEHAEIEREQRMAAARELALRANLERSEAALKQLNERSGKLNGAERKLEDLERIHADEKRKFTLEISSLQSQLDIARTTLISQSSRLRERDSSKRFEQRVRDLERCLEERDARVVELENELLAAEAQAEVYERRVEVYDGRVRAYKERVRVAEQRAREAEGEVEASLTARGAEDYRDDGEADYMGELLERFAVAYGELFGKIKEKEQELKEIRRAMKGKERMVEYLEEDLEMERDNARQLADEVETRRAESWEDEWPRWDQPEDDPRVEINRLLAMVHEGQSELRAMEIQRLEYLAQHIPPPPQLDMVASPTRTPRTYSPIPSSSRTTILELELEELRAECETLRAEQESLEQDLVDAAMDSDEYARQRSDYTRLQAEYASLQTELERVQSQSNAAQVSQSALSQLQSQHSQLASEFESYKLRMESTAQTLAEHEARAVLLNGSQAREQSLRNQIEGLKAQIAGLEKALQEEGANVKKAKERIVELESVEEGLRGDMDEMMEALDRVDRYEEAYETLVAEIVQLGLGDDDLDRLQSLSERTLGSSNAKQKLRYVEHVKMELDHIAQQLSKVERERDQARKEGADLRQELRVFQTVTGLDGWAGTGRSASTPPVRGMSTPLERITELSGQAQMRALGLGMPSTRVSRPGSTLSSGAGQQRRISRALSYAIEAEGVVPSLVEEQ